MISPNAKMIFSGVFLWFWCFFFLFFKMSFLSGCISGSVKELEGELRPDCHNCFLSIKHPSASTSIIRKNG